MAYLGVRHDERPVHFQRNIAVSGNGSSSMSQTQNLRPLEHSNDQPSDSPTMQTTPHFSRNMAASYIIKTHSLPNQREKIPGNTDYDMLTPIHISSEVTAHRDNTRDCISVHSKSTNSILNKNHTACHNHSKSPNRAHSSTTQLTCTGPAQRRTGNSKSTSAVSAPGTLQGHVPSNSLKKAGSGKET